MCQFDHFSPLWFDLQKRVTVSIQAIGNRYFIYVWIMSFRQSNEWRIKFWKNKLDLEVEA